MIGMEACGSGHNGGRTGTVPGLGAAPDGGRVRRPYRKRQSAKNDRADAEAILAALLSPGMRFIPVKTEALEAAPGLALPAARVGGQRTVMLNRIRG